MNEHQKDRFIKRIISCLFNTLRGKKIAVLGFAFKKDTSDTRESPAIKLVSNLIAEGALVGIYDPRVKEEQILNDLLNDGVKQSHIESSVAICRSPYDACRGADGVVVMTEWDEFSNKASPNSAGPLAAMPTGPGLSPSVTTVARADAARKEAYLHTPPKSPVMRRSVVSQVEPRGYNEKRLAMVSIHAQTSSRERLDWARIAQTMKKPMFVFDGRNILDSAALERLGFRVEAIGKARTAF